MANSNIAFADGGWLLLPQRRDANAPLLHGTLYMTVHEAEALPGDPTLVSVRSYLILPLHEDCFHVFHIKSSAADHKPILPSERRGTILYMITVQSA